MEDRVEKHRADATKEVHQQKRPLTVPWAVPVIEIDVEAGFRLRGEGPQEQHVPQQMEESAVKKHRGEDVQIRADNPQAVGRWSVNAVKNFIGNNPTALDNLPIKPYISDPGGKERADHVFFFYQRADHEEKVDRNIDADKNFRDRWLDDK